MISGRYTYHRTQIREALGFRESTGTIPTLSRAGWKTKCPRWNTGQIARELAALAPAERAAFDSCRGDRPN